MLKEIEGDVWNFATSKDYICILTNRTIMKDGRNPMGGGIAREAVVRNPSLNVEELVANRIENNLRLICTDEETGAWLWRFDTKEQVWLPSTLELIEKNLIELNDTALSEPFSRFFLPRPGCGFGGLDWESQVKPLCKKIIKAKNIYIVSK